MTDDKTKTDAEWRELLSDEQYRVLRKHGTERAFSHPFNHYKDEGTYVCAGCGADLFKSDAKFDSEYFSRVGKCFRRALSKILHHPVSRWSILSVIVE